VTAVATLEGSSNAGAEGSVAAVREEYKVDLEVFEGPLDLLLYLIKRDEVDIYNIPIERITTQYMEYLDVMRMLDLGIAGEFIVMAATLMMIKSRMLLPVDERPDAEEEEEGEDPRWELVRQLVEYKKFKDAASGLQAKELEQENVFGTGGHTLLIEPEDRGVGLHDVSLFDLIAAFNEVLKHAPPEELHTIAAETVTVADKIDEIVRRVRDEKKLSFASLFPAEATRGEIVCTFLALLELARLSQVRIAQHAPFDDIEIEAPEVEDLAQ
jgi:segregation and condensation protein A